MADSIHKIFAAPHFHFDLEWWKTEEEYSRDVEVILTRALELLESDPNFTYVLDQAMSLRPFLEQHPEARETLRRYVREGRVEAVGGTLAAPDENIPTGESLVRQFVYGRRWFRRELGCDVKTAWEIDEFGHPEQMPQILSKSGFTQFMFARGVPENRWSDHPIDFHWQAPDGSRILTHWLSAHYPGLIPIFKPSLNRYLFSHELRGRINHQTPNAASDNLFLPLGSDFTIPTDEWAAFIEVWNRKQPENISFSLPASYFEAVRNASNERIPVVKGEFNPMLTGCYETRYKIKQLCRRAQFGILETERITAIAWALGYRAWPQQQFDAAWEEILKNDFHDTICGTGTDRVYRDTLKRYEKAEQITDKIRVSSINIIARKADTTTAPGQPVLVFNSLNHARRDVASLPLDALKGQKNIENKGFFNVTDERGRRIPCQVSGDRLLFMPDVPAMGYTVCFVNSTEKEHTKTISNPLFNRNNMVLENEFFHLKLDARTGCMLSLIDKNKDQELLDPNNRLSNGLVVEEEVGNLWTVQKTGREWDCGRYPVKIDLLEQGPVRATIEIQGPHMDMTHTQRISIYNGIPRIECEVDIDFQGRDRRVRVDFHTNNLNNAVFETPYGATKRGNGHHCAQTWVDMYGNGAGLAVLNRGNPGHEVADNRLSLILFRSVSVFPTAGLARFVFNNLPGILTRFRNVIRHASQGLALSLAEWELYPYHGLTLREWASEGMERREASAGLSLVSEHIQPFLTHNSPAMCWERGRHAFKYALMPHSGDFHAPALPFEGLSYNTPLITVTAVRSAGALPARFSFMDTGGDKSVLVTAMKRAESGKGLALRAYDAHGMGADISLKCARDIRKIAKTNLTETDVYFMLAARRGRAKDRLSPWEIGTYLVDLAPKS